MTTKHHLLIIPALLLASCATPTSTPQACPTCPPPPVASQPQASPVDTLQPTPAFTATPEPTATVTPTSGPAPGLGSTAVRPSDGMVMVYIPAGDFRMGVDIGFTVEMPAHSVPLEAFWLDRSEVTVGMFLAFLNGNGEGNRIVEGIGWLDPMDEDLQVYEQDGAWVSMLGKDSLPVVEVSWYGAQAYCAWAATGGRLPSEAEWEKAARGGLEDERFPWGNADPSCEKGAANGAQHNECGGKAAVMSFAPNGYGLYDMSGNVWEWVADVFASYPGGEPYGSDNYGQGYRVVRGGSYIDTILRVSTFYRGSLTPGNTEMHVGFRCALSP